MNLISVLNFKMTTINGDLKFMTRINEKVCCSGHENELKSRDMRFPTMLYVRPAKA